MLSPTFGEIFKNTTSLQERRGGDTLSFTISPHDLACTREISLPGEIFVKRQKKVNLNNLTAFDHLRHLPVAHVRRTTVYTYTVSHTKRDLARRSRRGRATRGKQTPRIFFSPQEIARLHERPGRRSGRRGRSHDKYMLRDTKSILGDRFDRDEETSPPPCPHGGDSLSVCLSAFLCVSPCVST